MKRVKATKYQVANAVSVQIFYNMSSILRAEIKYSNSVKKE